MTTIPTADTAVPTRKSAVLRFILRRLSERSTYSGAVLLLSAVIGVTVDGVVAERIAALGIAIAGVIGLFLPDTLSE